MRSILIAILICTSLTLGCNSGKSKSSGEGALTVVNFDLEVREHGIRWVIGTLKNNSVKPYSYIEIEFDLYDDRGKKVGSAIANVNDIGANETWKFTALVTSDKAKKAKLKGVTGIPF